MFKPGDKVEYVGVEMKMLPRKGSKGVVIRNEDDSQWPFSVHFEGLTVSPVRVAQDEIKKVEEA